MKISIALCTYNGEKFIVEQLESLARQTRLPDEVIVCDDLSSDKTIALIEDFASKSSLPIKVYENEKNLGVIKNFEKAITLCTGDIIFLSDQDDVWHEQKLEKFTAVFAADKAVGLVFCDGELVDENLNSIGKGAWEIHSFNRHRQKLIKQGDVLRLIWGGNVVSGCMMAFRAKYRPLFLPIPNDIHKVIHDYWIAIILTAAAKTEVIPAKLVKYRQHSRQQIGLSADNVKQIKGIGDKLNKLDFQIPLNKFEGLKKNFNRQFKQHLEKHKTNKNILNEMDLLAEHYQNRKKIAESRQKRLRLILKELLSLHYHRYSNGWRSAAKDLMA